ncbi:hypothetical protein [Pigmentiphaga soli]
METPAGGLADLWQRRSRLSGEETARLYQIVQSALARYHPPELQALPEDKEELVAQFLFAKVLRLDPGGAARADTGAHSAPSNAYAICAYFRNFLIDCLRSASRQRNVSLDADDMSHVLEHKPSGSPDPVREALLDHGLDEEAVARLARRFIAGLAPEDRLLLAGGLGQSVDDRGGLSQLAARHRIASYHYRAGKLGIVLKKGALPAAFARTRIGVWMSDTLGIEVRSENRQAILFALGILAAQASAAQEADALPH